MSVRRIMGIETEYGILAVGEDAPGAREASELVVETYMTAGPGRGRSLRPVTWDYGGEDPLNDSRGHRIAREDANASMRTDELEDGTRVEREWSIPEGFERRLSRAVILGGRTEQLVKPPEPTLLIKGIPNAVLTNGARLYVDHSHPEYSGPECTEPDEVVRWDRAADLAMARTMELLDGADGAPEVVVYKNNVDGKGAAYGSHENYLLDREVPFEDVVEVLIPFFVTRPILCGTGRVGLGPRSEEPGFQISQRADYVETEVGLQTTFDRPIVNTRDEPHADGARHRRLHVIGGDATSFDMSTYLRLGTTSLVLWLLEAAVAGPVADAAREAVAALRALRPADPIEATRHVSRDLTMRTPFALAGGGEASSLDVQRAYLDAVRSVLDADAAARSGRLDAPTTEVLHHWERVLDGLATNPVSVAGDVEWVAKHALLDGLRARAGGDWGDARVRAVDLQWHDLRPGTSLVRKLEAAGRVVRRISDEDVADAEVHAPATTRAYLRGEALRRYPNGVAAASWSSLVLDLPGEEHHVRIPLLDPERGAAGEVEAILDSSPLVRDLAEALAPAEDTAR